MRMATWSSLSGPATAEEQTGPTPEQRLFQATIIQAFLDATFDGSGGASSTTPLDTRSAADWIKDCGRDFRMICDCAGWDAQFLSDAFKAGRVDGKLLRRSEESARRSR